MTVEFQELQNKFYSISQRLDQEVFRFQSLEYDKLPGLNDKLAQLNNVAHKTLQRSGNLYNEAYTLSTCKAITESEYLSFIHSYQKVYHKASSILEITKR